MTTAAPCCHHEIIEPPDGPVSIGRCLYCGREKEYQNTNRHEYNAEPLNEPRTLGRKREVWR